ncbi:TonB-dependent receptor plug domain-containing protein [Aquamicrobium terrae]|uniref:Vitamin B12 transporter n=1 Tax=Aquamicrobium terrae TaxID=1324945 RepID=A0ABV2N3Y6_9HYPH
MRTTILAAGVCALALTGPGWAQQSANSDDDTIQLDTIVVTTPLRRASSLERSTSSVTVIGEEEIRKSAALDLLSLLKTQPGITATSNGGLGADSSLSLRGASAAQTLILVNGVRAASATAGTLNLSSIPLDSIDRIEIARGGHSAQYGADAIGGIINIITKQGGSCPEGKSACGSVTAGVMHPWGGALSGNVIGRSQAGVNFALGASLLGTQGYDFTTAPYELDKDGFIRGALNLSLSKDLEWGRLYFDGLASRGRTQYDNAYEDWLTGDLIEGPNESDTTNFAGRLGARIDHGEDWSSTVELSSALDDSSNFRGNLDGDDFRTLRYGILASTQKSFEAENTHHLLAGGVEAYRETVDGSTVGPDRYDEDTRNLVGVFGQYSFEFEALTLDSGLRYDHNGQFGSKVTYNIGASYELTDGLVLRASHTTGFRAPTFNDLYYPDAGNPNLKPEESSSYEVGLHWQATGRTLIDLSVYRNDIDEMIAWAPEFPGSWNWIPSNIEKARVSGFEASIEHRINDAWAARAMIDIREPLNRSAGEHGKYIIYGERFRGSVGVTYTPLEALSLGVDLLYVSSRYTDKKNLNELPSYITADFTASYAMDTQSRLKFTAQNIFDKDYQTKDGYRAPGRTLGLSFTRSF